MAARNWRPHTLVFTDDLGRGLDLVRFGSWFSQGRGVVTVCELVVGDLLQQELSRRQKRRELQDVLDSEGIVAFAEVDVVESLVEGISSVAQANGIAGMESNMVLVGWPEDQDRLVAFLKTLRRLDVLEKSMVIARIEPRYLFPRKGITRTIDVWWGGLERNGDLMLLLAHLLSSNRTWHSVHVRIMSIASNEMTQRRTESALEKMLPESRITAEPRVLLKLTDRTIQEMIREESKEADVVFMGLAIPEEGNEASYAERLTHLSEGLNTVFFVRNSSPFGGELV